MKDKKQKVAVRIAPSPSGYMHIGLARTALFNYLFAKKHDGKFILRIEDTDTSRSKKDYEDNITESLSWLGLKWDEFYRQSERTSEYKKELKKMVDGGKAYVSKEEIKKEGDRDEVIRFKNPNIKIKFTDIIRGEIEFDTTELGDFIIAKSFDEPLYHLAAVVDDFKMGITHIIRGEDHISNTPRQILIGEALGAYRAIYAHIPLILAPDRSKLSKRHGAVAITEYRDMGYFSEALVNYLALLGWNPGTEQEIFSLKELISIFTLEKVQKGGAVFNIEKLDWINREYLKTKDWEILNEIKKYEDTLGFEKTLLPLVKERISKFSEIKELVSEGELGFLKLHDYQNKKLIWKNDLPDKTVKYLEEIIKIVEKIKSSTFTPEIIKTAVMAYADKEGRGSVLWPMRYALTGKDKSPDPFTVAYILGHKETLKRLHSAIKKLNE